MNNLMIEVLILLMQAAFDFFFVFVFLCAVMKMQPVISEETLLNVTIKIIMGIVSFWILSIARAVLLNKILPS